MARQFRNISGIEQYIYNPARDLLKIPPDGIVEGDFFEVFAGAKGPLKELIHSKSGPSNGDTTQSVEAAAVTQPAKKRGGRKKGLASKLVMPPVLS